MKETNSDKHELLLEELELIISFKKRKPSIEHLIGFKPIS